MKPLSALLLAMVLSPGLVVGDEKGTTIYGDKSGRDYWVDHAVSVIHSTYGDHVSVDQKQKVILKFGHSDNIGTSKATVAHQPSGILHETYVSANDIDTIVSTAAGDNTATVIEGHTVDGSGNFTFVVQSVTLTGQTEATLTTPLARVSRVYNNGATDWTGTVSVFQATDGSTAGVPTTDTDVHLQVEAGENQSEKAATTISKDDYWIVTGMYADFLDKTAGAAEVILQIRQKGKVFRNQLRLGVGDGSEAVHKFKPYFIVPANADVRIISSADGASTSISAGIEGPLAKIIE